VAKKPTLLDLVEDLLRVLRRWSSGRSRDQNYDAAMAHDAHGLSSYRGIADMAGLTAA